MNSDSHLQSDRRLALLVGAIACLVSCGLVLLDLWGNRELFDPEGITYLDMADACYHGHWKSALIGLWSPLYPWLLAAMMFLFNPSARWEFTAVHAVNFFIYLAELASFSVFLRAFLQTGNTAAAERRLPDWSWVVLGYALFTWSVIQLMPLHLPEPDSLVCALVYLIFARLLRIRTEALTWGGAIFLGALLGLGYLAKAIMFPMAFVFLGVFLIAGGRSVATKVKLMVSFFVFLALSLPYIAALSSANGHWMFSDAGRLNYVWEVNGVKPLSHWQGEEGGHGTPAHPTRKIQEDPPMYEFGTPFKVTYPPWYNPSYWYEGVRATVDVKRQLSVMVGNIKALFLFLADGLRMGEENTWYELKGNWDKTIGPLPVLCLVMVLANFRRGSFLRRVKDQWYIFFPIAAVFGAYSMLHFEGRYIAPYSVVLWLYLFRSAGVPYSDESKRFFTATVASAALVILTVLVVRTGRTGCSQLRAFATGNAGPSFLQSGYTNWQVAKYLSEAGVSPGESVGAVGWTYSAYWARMARVHVVAEIPADGKKAFWSSDDAKKAAVMALFRSAGAQAVVADSVPESSAPVGWQQIGKTQFCVFVFPKVDQRPSLP